MSRTDEPSVRSIVAGVALLAAVAALSEWMAIPIVANAQWSRDRIEVVPLYDLTQTRDPELIALAENIIAEDEDLADLTSTIPPTPFTTNRVPARMTMGNLTKRNLSDNIERY